MDLCVVWKTNRKKPIPDDKRWQNIGGVWWLEAKSKWTRKETYGEILRFFARFGLAAYCHDSHSGHLGEFPKLWLGTIACTDFTIPSNSFQLRNFKSIFENCSGRAPCRGTGVGQPADRPNTNKKLKSIAENVMTRNRLVSKLREEVGKKEDISRKGKEYISEVLREVRDTLNREPEKIRKAFDETLLGPPHSQLETLLKKIPEPTQDDEKHQPQEKTVFCRLCGESWKTKKPLKVHACFYRREHLLEPLLLPLQ